MGPNQRKQPLWSKISKLFFFAENCSVTSTAGCEPGKRVIIMSKTLHCGLIGERRSNIV